MRPSYYVTHIPEPSLSTGVAQEAQELGYLVRFEIFQILNRVKAL